jgi:predicted DNA-binding ArsR family transcriptional regulator
MAKIASIRNDKNCSVLATVTQRIDVSRITEYLAANDNMCTLTSSNVTKAGRQRDKKYHQKLMNVRRNFSHTISNAADR